MVKVETLLNIHLNAWSTLDCLCLRGLVLMASRDIATVSATKFARLSYERDFPLVRCSLSFTE